MDTSVSISFAVQESFDPVDLIGVRRLVSRAEMFPK